MSKSDDIWDLCRKAYIPLDLTRLDLNFDIPGSEPCQLKSEPPLGADVIDQLRAAPSLQAQLGIISKAVFPRAVVSVKELSPNDARRVIYVTRQLSEFLGV